MDERWGSPIRVAYLGAAGSDGIRRLQVESDRLWVEHIEEMGALRDRLPAVDCVVVAHEPGHTDGFGVLELVSAATVDRPVVVIADPAVTAEAHAAGATEVLGADPTDPPVAVLGHRITQALSATDREDDANAFPRRAIDTLSDVVYILDTDGMFQQWNDKLLEVTVYEESELPGRTLSDLVVPEDRETLTGAIECAGTDGVTETREAALTTAVGDRVTYDFNITPLLGDEGAVVGLAGTAREVTERKLREQRLAVLTRVLRHNVRNRMTVVQGRAEQLESNIGTDSNLDAIEQAATELVALSDKARRVEAALRESSTNRRAFDVVAMTETSLAALARAYPDANLAIQSRESVNARTTEALTFAIEELIRNGIVHNDSDQPRVKVTIRRDEQPTTASEANPEMVAIRVSDNGSGIPETEQVALTTGRETDLEHSTGLGLWLVNWVVTAAGGNLVCETCDDLGGASVTLRFPAAGR